MTFSRVPFNPFLAITLTQDKSESQARFESQSGYHRPPATSPRRSPWGIKAFPIKIVVIYGAVHNTSESQSNLLYQYWLVPCCWSEVGGRGSLSVTEARAERDVASQSLVGTGSWWWSFCVLCVRSVPEFVIRAIKTKLCQERESIKCVTTLALHFGPTGLCVSQTCPVANAIYCFRDPSVFVGVEGYFGRL
uniref:Uncharacterized protein n=1 Tax=Timema cristinae TaxID=61476 RepID=A0A7R9CLP9_TIMCR|nr:unnamed protein product [Timema cristinae]